jgi:isoleucyl-tRNA synthetase
VRAVRRLDELGDRVSLSATPAFPVLGKKYGKGVPRIAQAIKSAPEEALAAFMKNGALTVEADGQRVELGRDDLTVQVAAARGYGASEERGLTVILNLAIDEELRLEGAAREVINRIQNLRKNSGLDVTDHIHLRYSGGEMATRVFQRQGDLIAAETLADETGAGEAAWPATAALELDGETVTLWIQKSR